MAPRGVLTAHLDRPFRATVIACPGRGKTTILVPALRAAGLQALSVTSLDSTRRKLYGRESILGDGNLVEKETRSQEDTLMDRGKSVVRDATGLNVRKRRTDILRARRYDFASVALLAAMLPIREIRRRNLDRKHPVPDEWVDFFYQKQRTLTVQALLDEGFDTVIVWSDRTTFTIG